MAGKLKFTAARKKLFLEVLAETANVTRAAKAAGVTTWTAYEARKQDAAFADQWHEAVEEACDLMEAEALRRAVDGVAKPVFYQGKQCGEIQEYSDTLLIFLLKAHRPEKFRDNARIELTGKDGGPVQTEKPYDLSKLSVPELEQLKALYEKAASGAEK